MLYVLIIEKWYCKTSVINQIIDITYNKNENIHRYEVRGGKVKPLVKRCIFRLVYEDDISLLDTKTIITE